MNTEIIARLPILTALQTTIGQTGNDDIDALNTILDEYPLVWGVWFERDSDVSDEDELISQAESALRSVEDYIAGK